MGNKMFVLFCGIIYLQSCNTTNYLPAFDFELFSNTPVKELAKAVENENVQIINQILKDTLIKVDYQEQKFGHTLLMLAIANNKIKSVDALLKNKANPNLSTKNKEDNSWSIATENYPNLCDTSILSLLADFNTDINFIQNIDRVEHNGMHSVVKRTLLMIAVRNDCYAISKFLIDKGANINVYTYYDGYGAITEGIIHNNINIVKYLIIDKKAIVPKYCYIRDKGGKNEQKLTVTDLLKEQQYDKETENYKLREEIINYLKSKNLR